MFRCTVSLRGNGVKVLTANSFIPPNTPVIEFRGKYMLASQLSTRARVAEYVLFHKISSELEVCVDSKTYGNDSRFCRKAETKSSEFNAEVGYFSRNCCASFYSRRNCYILINFDGT